ncbi:HlyD family secretion protein [Selenomonas sp. oral taxon 892]|uniref:HlyD family secretion protein n=1 Tax=Selenomonas sp. oral taxon 892 TaxID=1321785 RepID=UPI0004282AEE|nr:HlyD family efflux transporter periplasmic adaptor subunit [Selenomonas sp. oral taxon 892]
MNTKMMRVVLLLLAIVLLSVFAYRAYVEQEGRAQLLTGTVEATRVEVSAKESGYIDEILVREGMAVRAGDVAARIERRDLAAARLRDEAALAHARTNLARTQSGSRTEEVRAAAERTRAARAAADRAGADYARGIELLTAGAIAQQAFDALREARDTADANLHAREEEQRLLENGSRPEDIRMAEEDVRRQQAILAMDDSVIDDLTIRIPRDGIVLTKNYEAGEFVRAGASVATLIDPSDVWIKIYVTTDMLGSIHLGDSARVYIDGQAEPLNGIIAEISDAAEFTLRQSITKNERANLVFGVKVAVDNAAGILKPGMPADVDLGARHGT